MGEGEAKAAVHMAPWPPNQQAGGTAAEHTFVLHAC